MPLPVTSLKHKYKVSDQDPSKDPLFVKFKRVKSGDDVEMAATPTPQRENPSEDVSPYKVIPGSSGRIRIQARPQQQQQRTKGINKENILKKGPRYPVAKMAAPIKRRGRKPRIDPSVKDKPLPDYDEEREEKGLQILEKLKLIMFPTFPQTAKDSKETEQKAKGFIAQEIAAYGQNQKGRNWNRAKVVAKKTDSKGAVSYCVEWDVDVDSGDEDEEDDGDDDGVDWNDSAQVWGVLDKWEAEKEEGEAARKAEDEIMQITLTDDSDSDVEVVVLSDSD